MLDDESGLEDEGLQTDVEVDEELLVSVPPESRQCHWARMGFLLAAG